MEYFKSLPTDITLDILTRLPTDWVIECKSVSKTWYNLISHHPSFTKMHLQHLNHPSDADSAGKSSYIALTGFRSTNFHYFEYNHGESKPIKRIRRMNLPSPWETVSCVGSCNGLICFARQPYLEVKIVICNPITREFVRLPQMEIDFDFGNVHWTSGFGYVSSTNEYKVIRIMLKNKFVDVHIYTLGSGKGWRSLGELKIENSRYDWDQGTFANGAIYWKNIELEMIMTFDLAEEKFCELLSPPPLPQDSDWYDHRMGVLDGFLFFAVNEAKCFDVWLLKKKNCNHGKKEGEETHSLGWSKEFSVDNSILLAATKGDAVLTYVDKYLNIYDTKASTSKRLVDFKDWVHEVLPHKNTLVSLKELGEEDREIMESIEFTGQKARIMRR